MKFVAAVLGAIGLVACNGSRRSATPTPLAAPMRLAGCEGPATSLPDSLARPLPPRTGRMIPDDRWADLASAVPGGFEAVIYDSAHTHILMLSEQTQLSPPQPA